MERAPLAGDRRSPAPGLPGPLPGAPKPGNSSPSPRPTAAAPALGLWRPAGLDGATSPRAGATRVPLRNSACRVAKKRTDPSSSLPEAQSAAQTPSRLHSLRRTASQPTTTPPRRRDGRTRRKCGQTSPAPGSGFWQTPLLLLLLLLHGAPRRYPPRAPAFSAQAHEPARFSREKRSGFSFPAEPAGSVFPRRGCRGPSGMSAPSRAGRSGTGGGVPSSPECAGSAGEGRRRARQCHGLIFIPISWCGVAPLPPLPPRPGRAGRGAPGCRGTSRGRAQAAVEGTGSPSVWGRRLWVGGGAPRTL